MADYTGLHDTPVIVAAIECNAGPNNERLVEYSPYRFDDPNYGHLDGKGKDTLSTGSSTSSNHPSTAPHRTLPDRAHTFIGGKPMGGLMSLYALLAYNDVFGRRGHSRPPQVAPAALMNLTARTKLASGTVLYMDYGSKEMVTTRGCGKAWRDAW